jgi:hypothetical protein
MELIGISLGTAEQQPLLPFRFLDFRTFEAPPPPPPSPPPLQPTIAWLTWETLGNKTHEGRYTVKFVPPEAHHTKLDVYVDEGSADKTKLIQSSYV